MTHAVRWSWVSFWQRITLHTALRQPLTNYQWSVTHGGGPLAIQAPGRPPPWFLGVYRGQRTDVEKEQRAVRGKPSDHAYLDPFLFWELTNTTSFPSQTALAGRLLLPTAQRGSLGMEAKGHTHSHPAGGKRQSLGSNLGSLASRKDGLCPSPLCHARREGGGFWEEPAS